MLFLVRNSEIVKDVDKTYLTASVAAAGVTLTVKAVDSNAWADNDWVLVGEIGTKNAEILQANGTVSDGTSITVDNAGTGGARYAHSIDEPVYRLAYNQIEFSRATTETGSKSTLATNEIQPDDEYTRYTDTANTTGFGFVRFKNTTTTTYSAYSDGIPYTGYTAKSLGRMIKSVRRSLGEDQAKGVSDEDITEELNEKQRDVAHERLWPFYEDIFSASSVAYQRQYNIDSSCVDGKVHTLTFKSDPLAKLDAQRFDTLHWDTAVTGDPTHFLIWKNKISIYPLYTSAAQTTTLDGSLTTSAVAITVVSTASFSPSGRIIIDSEVISYSSVSTTQFLGCTRGDEGTTEATHSTAATVTERDIVYTAHREPTELVDVGDETEVPDPRVLVDGTCMELAIGQLNNQVLHDRFKGKYEAGQKRLRDKFGRKGTFSFFLIKDKEEMIRDTGRLVDPNQFPKNFS